MRKGLRITLLFFYTALRITRQILRIAWALIGNGLRITAGLIGNGLRITIECLMPKEDIDVRLLEAATRVPHKAGLLQRSHVVLNLTARLSEFAGHCVEGTPESSVAAGPADCA